VSNLNRLRTGARAVLASGVAVSVAANVLVAQPDAVSRSLAAIPPLALTASIELLSRVPGERSRLSSLRVLVTAAVGAIAAWMSYFHMVELARRSGESNAHLLPLAVDGMILVATITLLDIGRQLRRAEELAEAERVAALQRAQELQEAAERDAELARLEAERERQEEERRAAETQLAAEQARWDSMTPRERTLELLMKDQGLSNRKIAGMVGASDVSVGQWRRAAGYAPSMSRRTS